MNKYIGSMAIVLTISVLFHSSFSSARTVIGELWSSQCDSEVCAADAYCALVQENTDRNPDSRNLVCPSSAVIKEVDRVSYRGDLEPFTFYLSNFEITYERRVGDRWIPTTFTHQVRGREIIECACSQNRAETVGAVFCSDLPKGRYNIQGEPEIYEDLANNHGERCPPVDTAAANEDDGKGCVGNPCNPATGNKYQSETDIFGGLNFTRSYNSRNLFDHGSGKGWRNNYQKRLAIQNSGRIKIISSKGAGEQWFRRSGNWRGGSDTRVLLTETSDGYSVTRENADVENYDPLGRLLSEVDTQGKVTTYEYGANERLSSVTNNYGLSLNFSYDGDDHLVTVTSALGEVYTYSYDANDNLVSVVYPDTTSDDNTDNPRRIYHYENTQYPNHLTGITDENGDRYATWAYDADGKAISTEHAQTTNTVGQEKFELDYQGSN